MKCNAPLNNMYFTVFGTVGPCWLQVGAHCDTWSDTRSISDIWFGDSYKTLRNQHQEDIWPLKCELCKKETEAGVWPLARAYEKFPIKKYPTLIELELSNQCNLECIMCSGILSSGIRKNRDKLPPLPMAYNEKFVDQLNEFIPHLTELRFNGGEPLAQKIVLDICENVSKIKPELKVNIATNGTVYNKNVIKLLENCNIHLNISIDSLIKERYEKIRINGDFDVLMKNFEIFKKYCHDNDRSLSVMVNPMRNNWKEMVNFARWAHKHEVNLWFNTIRYPEHLALWNLPSKELIDITYELKEQLQSVPKWLRNYDKIDHLINKQISDWALKSSE